jgi:hypothetical protein
MDGGTIDTCDGRRAISNVDEDSHIRKTYEAAVSAEGMTRRMPEWVYSQRTPPEGEYSREEFEAKYMSPRSWMPIAGDDEIIFKCSNTTLKLC